MKSFLFVLLMAVAVSAQQQQPQSQPQPSDKPAQAEPAPQPPPADVPKEEEPVPGAAPKPGHPLDPADVQTLTSKPATSMSPAQRAGYPPQVYYYYPNDVPLFGYPYGYPRNLRMPRTFHTNQPLLQLGPGGPNLIVPLGRKKPATTAPKK